MKKFFIIFSLVAISGCSKKVQQKIGISDNVPEETKIVTVKPLEVPPYYTPGAISVQSNSTEK